MTKAISKVRQVHPRLNILIAIPSMGDWKSATAMDVINCVRNTDEGPLLPGVAEQCVRVSSITGSVLPKLRRNAVLEAQRINATHILFIDSDMRFPRDLLRRMLAHEKLIVAANCPTKTVPISPTARLKATGKDAGPGNYWPIFTTPDTSPRLMKVDRIGFGIILIDMRVFTKIPEPWFDMVYRPDVKEYMGEDWFFCVRCEKYGIPIFIDHDVSWEIQHVGNAAFKHTMCKQAWSGVLREEKKENDDEESVEAKA